MVIHAVNNDVKFMCDGCNNLETIRNNFVLDIIKSDKQNNMSDDINEMCHSNILRRTKAYVCPNKKCPTHKDVSEKEALYYRVNNNTYKTHLYLFCMQNCI